MAPKKVKKIDGDPYWGWVYEICGADSISTDHVRAAYRLHSAPCAPGACKKNCRLNPCCINGLGEQQWLKKEREGSVSSDEFSKRKKGELIGLRNRGATCYVNAFLQMCFHNREFRSAVYAWRGTPQSDSEKSESDCDDSLPTTVCGLLQYVFAALELSEMKFVDPTPLLRKLELDDGVQQDSLEFGKLFLGRLTPPPDDPSITAHDQALRERINEMFSGECRDITRCHSCSTESAKASPYTEIGARVEGMRGLSQALDDYVKDETIDGENMYYCDVCRSKQPASRRTELKSVPPVLQVHLLRYVYDRVHGVKKKVRTRFQFPEVLAMGPYLGKGENDDLYDLAAILLHNGTSAHSGHYVAHICLNGTTASTGADEVHCLSTSKQLAACSSSTSGSTSWFKFSDDVIVPIANPKTELGKIENEGKDEAKTQKVPSGLHASTNAYMLVYKSRQSMKGRAKLTDMDVPKDIKDIIDKENKTFLSTIAELERDSMQKKESEAATREFVKETYRSLSLQPDFLTSLAPRTVVAIGGQWLSQWLKHPDGATKINNEVFMCDHGKINVNEVQNIKFVSVEGARKLYERYGVSPELDLTMTCAECVERVFSRKRLDAQMTSDLQAITNGMQPYRKSVQLEGYAVGKDSLRALKTLMERHIAITHPHGASAVMLDSTDSANLHQSAEPHVTNFNEDILCPHGHLCIDERQRLVATIEAWQKIKNYVPNALEFSASDAACSKCTEASSERRAIAVVLGKMLADVASHSRPQPYVDAEVYIIGRSFFDSLRQYISSKRTDLPVPVVDNSQLMCPHGNLFAEPTDSTLMISLWPQEWLILSQYSGEINSPISVLKKQDVNGDTDSRLSYTVLPGICQACCEERLAKIESQRFKYTSAKLFVYLVSGLDAGPTVDGSKRQDYGADVAEAEDGSDLDYVNQRSGKNAKKRKVADDAGNGDATTSIKDNEPAGPRRSRRRVRTRNGKELIVNSSITLRELKVRLMDTFAVAPYDQTLMVYGRVLEPDAATLEELRVEPDSIIQLKADEPHIGDDDDGDVEATLIRDGVQKEGFKGTGLLSGN